MKTTRRTFLKGTAAAGGIAVASQIIPGSPLSLVAGQPNPQAPVEEEIVPTTCWIGKQDCGILARKVNGRVVKFEGHPAHPRNMGTLCPKGVGQIGAIYDPNRVKTPLLRTNEKGVPGQFRPISWDEALDMVSEKMTEALARDPRLVVWQKGRSKAKAFYDDAFVKATGATKLHHGAFCSDAGYRACEYTVGLHGVLHPDMLNTRYLLAWGWNITGAGGNKFCWLTWPQQLMQAKEKGLKVVHIDPRIRSAGPHAEEWLPIRPGTDLPLALTLCRLLIKQGTIDREYLTQFTNSPYLVKDDGFFLRIDDKEQVWDENSNSAQPFDADGIEPALEGTFNASGTTVRTSFQVFSDHVEEYTTEWTADICGLPAESITRIARELADNAMIGSTTVVDGVTIPYRPVAIMAYHVSQQELGFQVVRAMNMIMMLLGAWGAVGGQQSDFTWKIHSGYKGTDEAEVKDSTNIYLKGSKFYPINSNNSSIASQVMQDPAKFGVDYIPEVAILHMVNPMGSFASQPDIIAAYKKFKFVAVIDPWLSLTADMFADVVLPAATIEKYEGPINATDQYVEAVTLRVPPMAPMFQSRGEIDIYMDLCEKAGILFGEDGYLDQVNKSLKLEDPYKIPTDRKPTVREIFDIWARSAGFEEGVAYFEKNGVYVKGKVSPTKRYGYVTDPPFGGAVHRLYGESLLRIQNDMRAAGADEVYWRDYTPLPTWRKLTMTASPGEYDLRLISYKLIEFKQSRSSQIPLLAELAPEQRLDINPKTARERGLENGEMALVESHNAITGETRQVNVRVHYTEGIRPDTVGMPHHYGEVAKHPWTRGQGPTANALYFTGPGYSTNTADQSFQVMVRVARS